MPVDPQRVMAGEDLRTYLCVMNVPNKYTKTQIEAEIDERHRGTYNRIELTRPKDNKPSNPNNPGFFFIDFKHPLFILDFYQNFADRPWKLYKSHKRAEINYASKESSSKRNSHHQRHRSHGTGNLSDKSGTTSSPQETQEMEELNAIIKRYNILVPLEKFSRAQPGKSIFSASSSSLKGVSSNLNIFQPTFLAESSTLSHS